jgi:hypothetical protein
VATAMSRGDSPVTVVLAAARGALSERRLVVTGAPNLSALAGARAGADRRHPANEKNTRMGTSSLKSRAHAGSATHIKLEKPCFPRGFRGRRCCARRRRCCTRWRPAALAGSSTDNPTAGASSAATSVAHGDRGRGRGFHLSGGAPSSLSSSSSSNDDPAGVPGEERPSCSRSRYSSLYYSRRSRR